MKRIYTLAAPLFSFITFLGCNSNLVSHKTPKPSSYGTIEGTKVINGFPNKSESWVVYSEKANNETFLNKNNEKTPIKINFLEPLIILNHDKTKKLVKVAKYNAESLTNKTKNKNINSYGWIPEDDLLLWSSSLKNEANGFFIKGSTVLKNEKTLQNYDRYIENDSILLFDSPSLTNKLSKKLPLGQLVYIYKQKDNSSRYFIANKPNVSLEKKADNSVYGWVSADVLTLWGDRSGAKAANKEVFDNLQERINIILPIGKGGKQTQTAIYEKGNDVHKIVATNLSKALTEEKSDIKFFTGIFDYDKNYVYNVLGNKLFYGRAKEITESSKNINLVFSIDASNFNPKGVAMAKSIMQNFQFEVDKYGFYNKIQYGAVLYKNNNCGNNQESIKLSSDFKAVLDEIDIVKRRLDCGTVGNISQPFLSGITSSANLLRNNIDDTNIIVNIGTTSNNENTSVAVRAISRVGARLVIFQTTSGTSNGYNNYVLNAEKLVSSTARNISQLKMDKIVDQNFINNKNNYDLEESEEGIYSLDYPKSSMTQGLILFPKKGDFLPNNLLAKGVDTIVSQVTKDNIKLNKSIKDIFKSDVGLANTNLLSEYIPLYPKIKNPIAGGLIKQIVSYDNPFLLHGQINKDQKYDLEAGILISEQEYNNLQSFFSDVYKETLTRSKHLDQKYAIKKYLEVVKKYSFSSARYNLNEMKNKSMADLIAYTTGYDVYNDDKLTTRTLKQWGDSKLVDPSIVKKYFDNYKKIADRLIENKDNPEIIYESNGEKYYWLNHKYLPNLQDSLTD